MPSADDVSHEMPTTIDSPRAGPPIGSDRPAPNDAAALREWTAALGDAAVCADDDTRNRYAQSTSMASTQPAAILYPESTAQVQEIVRIAARHRVPLYPISRGRNFGYGDACAPRDGQVIVDLGRMNRIVEVNTPLAYAVIEPGVTQQQLCDYLREHRTGLWVDSTGAGCDASFVGNTLDRGFGHTRYGDHFLTTCGMEVVLADGRVLRTGFGHYDGARAHRAYRYGVGPYLDGLFSQSNYGIVTQIGMWLMPEPEALCAFFVVAPRPEDLPKLIDRLARLRLAGLLHSAIHIANDLRTISARTRYPWDRAHGVTPLPAELRTQLCREFGIGAWNACGAIYGTRATVAATRRALRKAISGYRTLFINDKRLTLAGLIQRGLACIGLGRELGEKLRLVQPVFNLMKGIPSYEHLRGTAWRVRDPAPPETPDLPAGAGGFFWASPVVPNTGAAARDLMALIEPIYERHGFEALVTFTMITERAMIAVTNLAFDKREAEEAARARRCYDELFTALMDAGFVPYRSAAMSHDKLRRHPSVFWDVTAQIKQALDPLNIISPGRYVPDPPPSD